MDDSTDGKIASILAGQNRQDNEGHIDQCIASADSAAADSFINENLCRIRPDPADGREPTSSNTDVCMPLTEVSERSIAVLVGSVLCDCFKLAILEACVELLWLADQEKIAPEDFRRFLRARKVGHMAMGTMLADPAFTYSDADTGSPRRPAEDRRR